MIARIHEVRKSGDSVGGIIRAVVRNVPAGLGEPVFDKLTADLAKALMSLPATRGIEFGLGFDSVKLKGSEHNDAFVMRDGTIRTNTNRSGEFRVEFQMVKRLIYGFLLNQLPR
ncbi:MAG: hypothetical protein Ct9H300mP21_08150 [Pseudomonadota bacterium]|nr:MAG: hypothetical protein Ct9H300mP21_08150 [Pseudomonadota bacterium]